MNGWLVKSSKLNRNNVVKLSIITINFNNKKGLENTVASVMSQTWRDFEWIIIDGGSIDGSKELIEKLAKNPVSNISYWCSEKDNGIYNAMNKGVLCASGEYLNFMNSGDCFYERNTLERVFCANVDDDVIYGQVYQLDAEGNMKFFHYTTKASVDSYINHKFINHQSAYIKREWCLKHPYDEMFRISADTEFFMWILVHGAHFTHLFFPVVIYDACGYSWQNIEQCSKEESVAIASNVFDGYLPYVFIRLVHYYNTTWVVNIPVRLLHKLIRVLEVIGLLKFRK